MKTLIVCVGLIGVCLAVGPTSPHADAVCDEVGKFAVDRQNMCWYHECVDSGKGDISFIPRACALGSKVSYNFIQGTSNPCTINFDTEYGYECDRTAPSVDGPPACFANWRCENRGTAVYESDKCWCDCPETWLGDFDCSKPTKEPSELPAGSNICVGGEPLKDWCNEPKGGCLNGGVCYNQCNTFWCECPNREENDYVGKKCERKSA